MDLLPILYWVVLLILLIVGSWAAYSGGVKSYGPALLFVLLYVFIGIRLFPVALK